MTRADIEEMLKHLAATRRYLRETSRLMKETSQLMRRTLSDADLLATIARKAKRKA